MTPRTTTPGEGDCWPVGLLLIALPWLIGLWLVLLAPQPAAVDWSGLPEYRGWAEHAYTSWGGR